MIKIMKSNRLMFCLFLLLIGVTYSKGNPVVEGIIEVGTKLFEFLIDQLSKDPSDAEVKVNQEQLNRLVSDITAKLDQSTQSILFSIEYESQLSDLRQVSRVVDSLLNDLKNVLRASDSASRTEYINRYQTYFATNKVSIDEMDSILIGGSTSFLSGRSLLDLVTERLKCSIYDIENFENFYMKMASCGMALELGYELFRNFSKFYNTTQDKWTTKIKDMATAFDGAIDKCKLKFNGLAQEDFNTINNDTVLAQTLRRRFADKACDVLRITQSYIVYPQQNSHFIFMDDTDGLKLAIFNEQTRAPNLDQNSLKIFGEETDKVCIGDVNEVLKEIQRIVDSLLKWNRLTISSRLYLLFENRQNTSWGNTLDFEKDSPHTIIHTNCMDIDLLMYLEDAKPNKEDKHSDDSDDKISGATHGLPPVLTMVISVSVVFGCYRLL